MMYRKFNVHWEVDRVVSLVYHTYDVYLQKENTKKKLKQKADKQ